MGERRLGVFVSGFRWSGSSAVCDWLCDFDALARHAGTGPAFGEIRALNYGVQKMLLVAEGRAVFGERLARRALCPDHRHWPGMFGRTLYRARGGAWWLCPAVDALILMAVRRLLQPRLGTYGTMLREQLGHDAALEARYLEAAQSFMTALQGSVATGSPPADDPAVSSAVSALFALFYDRGAPGGALPVFDNAFAGVNAGYFRLLSPSAFARKAIYLVHRDPRDQFAELVIHSARTLPSMVGAFIREYQNNSARVEAVISSLRAHPGTSVHVVPFEEFVCSDLLRARLGDEVRAQLADTGLETSHTACAFDAGQSRGNIGVWRHAGLPRQMRAIAQALPGYLRPEAD